MKTEAPYGAWNSPLTATRVTAGALRLGEIALDGDDVYWIEGRASEGGRYVIVKRTLDGRTVDVTPSGFNARSRAHEYGGGAMTIHRGDVYFSNFTDQRLYLQAKGGVPVPLTVEGLFFAETRLDATRGRLVAVREDHRKGDAEPPAAIVAIDVPRADRAKDRDPVPTAGTVLVSGADFYSDPIVSPDGATLAWLQWNHPNMPWDGTELWTAAIKADGSLGAKTKIAGSADESIFQPEWSPDGVLYFVSDRTGWWNLYRLAAGGIQPLHPMSAEFGKPQWTFSMVTYAFAGPKRIAATYVQDGRWKLAFIETDPVRWEPVQSSLDVMESLRADERALYFVGASPTSAPVVARMTLAAMEPEVLRASTSDAIDAEWIAPPEPVTFSAGPSAPARDVHAFYYAPKNPRLLGAGRHHAAAAGADPRRADRGNRSGARRRSAVLDQPRLRRARRQLRRQHRLRPRLPRAPEGQLGHRRRRRLRQRARSYLVAARAGRREPPGHPRRQRRRLHHAGRAHLPPTSSRPAPATTASATSRRWPATPTSSSRATSTA